MHIRRARRTCEALVIFGGETHSHLESYTVLQGIHGQDAKGTRWMPRQGAEEGRGRLRKAPGSRITDVNPEVSEWGNLARVTPCHPYLNT